MLGTRGTKETNMSLKTRLLPWKWWPNARIGKPRNLMPTPNKFMLDRRGKLSLVRTSGVLPSSGLIKINIDASLSEEGWAGLGVVARDHKGKVIISK